MKVFNNYELIDNHLLHLEHLNDYFDEIVDDNMPHLPNHKELTTNINWIDVFKDGDKYPEEIAMNLVEFLSGEFDDFNGFGDEDGEWIKPNYNEHQLKYLVHEVIIPILGVIMANDTSKRFDLNNGNPLK